MHPPADPVWAPAYSLAALRARAELYAAVRQFFAARGVVEVDTPVLSRAASTDPNIESFATEYCGPGSPQGQCLYLHTSPEFAMKRLLAAGSGPIYQIAHVFRQGERGQRHHPEFAMLEWYRPGFDHHQLMDEVEDLVRVLLARVIAPAPALRLSYREAFQRYVGVDSLRADVGELARCAQSHGLSPSAALAAASRDTWLQWLMSEVLEPKLPERQLVFIFDFPASQAALARVRPDEIAVAERFELYCAGMELANGFHELTDAVQQLARFEADLSQRAAQGQPQVPLDARLLSALEAGLPDCAGVAVGLDRLLMLGLGAERIDATLAFPIERA